MKFNEIKRETKRRIYALALASIMVLLPKTKAYAAEVDMSTKVDIDHAISVLVPDDKPSNNNGGNNGGNNDNNNGGNNSGNNDNNNGGNNGGNNDNNNGGNNGGNNDNNNGENNGGNNDNNNGENNGGNNDNNNDGKDDNKDNNNDGKDDNKDNDDENKNEEEKCDHSYVSVDVTNQKTPSCTVAGSYDEVYQCSKCGATKTEHHSIPAPGHKWDGGTRVESKDGYDIIYHCTNKGCSSEMKTHHSNTPDPTEPTKPHKPTNPSDNPKMGDASNITEWASLMAFSGTSLLAIYANYEYKKHEKEKMLREMSNGYEGKYLSKRK